MTSNVNKAHSVQTILHLSYAKGTFLKISSNGKYGIFDGGEGIFMAGTKARKRAAAKAEH